MRRYVIDCRSVTSFPEFVEAVNVGLVRECGGEWTGNLDAFHDYLSWAEPQYELELLGSEACKASLGHAALAQKLAASLESCHPANRSAIEQRLERARQGLGPTLFDLVRQIVESEKHVRMILS